MLPSTGYFKGINCPFFDTGLCERPYCHFRHVKREQNGDGIESGEILQKLVSAAVQKVLRQNEATGLPSTSQDNVAYVNGSNSTQTGPVQVKATYSPTPIAELNKIHTESEVEDVVDKKRRHVPVPYTPRKPASLQIKRPVDTNGSKLYVAPIVQYTPGAESTQVDPYTPKGSIESSEKYLPGADAKIQEYLPNDSQETQVSNKHNYTPSDKYTTKNKIIEYKPAIVTKKCDVHAVKYQPTPKSLVPCFSSDEEEPEPKKRKISSDLNGFDDLGPEFDILDQILDEENKTDVLKTKDKKDSCTENVTIINKNDKSNSKKGDNSTSNTKGAKQNDKLKKSTKDSNHRSSHKSSHNNKEKEEKSYTKSQSSSSRLSKSKPSENKVSEKHTKSLSSRQSKSSSSRDKVKESKTHKESKSSRKSHNKHYKSHKKSKEKERKVGKRDGSASFSPDNKSFDAIETLENEVLSDSDEETIAEECKRIFEEYVPQLKTKAVDESLCKQEVSDEGESYIPTKKRISRTIDKNIKIVSKPSIKPDFKTNAAQTMAERLSKIRMFHASKAEKEEEKDVNLTKASKPEIKAISSPTISKVRIAHVPYASTLVTAKKSIAPPINKPIVKASTSFTSIQTVRKGEQRVAHVPNEKFIDRPGVLEPLGSKIPANIRSTYLNLMIDQCLNIYLSAVDAYARAQHEELTTSKKCSTVPIYKNSAVLAISRLKKELQESNGVKKSGNDCVALQKVPSSKNNTNSLGSWSIESRSKKIYDNIEQYTGAKFYSNIKKWILTEEQLQLNGFPRTHSSGDKGRAIIYGQNKQKPPKGSIRTCCRCKKEYTINKKGFPIIKEECIYHPNNKYRVRGEVKYQCCSQDGSSDGCCVAESHVYEYVDFDNLKGFVKTFPPQREMENYGIYSLDCEMCYTTYGLDLTRVTVINTECKVIYETLVKPLHPIIDYNTRYSGITEQHMSQVNTTLLEVQATLLSMFNSKTILIGHSLESDFKALKLIHDTVIDTSVLYPHKMGPPFKRALRNLSSEYLKKIIQNSVDGHDSAEDATVCMELLHYKLKEDLKTR
ncbi:RNA exonuclease 1 homolog [Pieris brassicae]|uniref:RNA exonuclease 1 homolog n=1 Tax=Pieris brassicae TaxID=7116 RepID=UPI001E65F140|nr:RNA exonuclease 1 homolog [Pieris brassicae]